MADGDWHGDSRIRHSIVNIQLTKDGKVHHIGVGYEMVSPAGNILASRGWTWPISGKLRKRLEAILDEMNIAVVRHEGVAGMDFHEFPEDDS